ncbi:MAG: carboxyl-terminal processing protease [Candidatus Peregrinibacteria bacterium Greene0416_62]|nr:MAG: carboxyl-terminal processing protease [Candidatus Peregrinibacteria bacterium Greene0416_62]TSC97851.1 MAG: carboxyl-terminal processing protease [Candidatus Peregrinibacteria bacterium Greene1014_49]
MVFAGEWGLPDTGDVSRGAFIRAVARAFELQAHGNDALPYRRISKDMIEAVRAVHERDALSIFGKDLRLAAAITRGESIQITAKLAGLGQSGDGKTNFRDVRDDTALARSVDVAIDQEWLVPVRSTQFGVTRTLTGKEAEKMLKKASGRAGQQRKESGDSMTSQTIRIKLPVKEKTTVVPKSDILQTVWQLINDEYLYQDKVSADEAAYGAIEGMVESLDDPYTTFFRPVKAQNFRNQIKGEVTGIGAQVEDKAGVLTIVTPLRGSPAEKAGLLPGDEILAADDVSLAGLSFLDAVEKVRGPKGSTVKLTIRRNGTELSVSVMRDIVTVPEIEVTMQEGVGIVRIMQFGQATDTKLRAEMEKLALSKPKGVILDLRNNPGGLEHAATMVVSNFLPKGSIVSIIKSRTSSEEHKTADHPTFDVTVPLVLLINGGSASASEIVAGALQDTKRAILVGEKTFGKGTVQAVLQFNDQSSLKLTIAEWLTPLGRKIDKVGIEPDIKVVYSTERDEQMLKALDLLRR